MVSKLVTVLREIGPCLTGAAADHLAQRFSITPDAARQQIARRAEPVRELKLDFPRRARFLYLPDQWQSSAFWSALGDALVMAGGAYARTIWALSARGGILPSHQFAAATATGASEGQVDAEEVKTRLVEAGLLEEVELEGAGTVVGFVEALQNEHMVAQFRGRMIAEAILLDSLKEWARRLNLGSWGRFRLRGDDPAPTVNRFEWDLSAPSYLGPLRTFADGKLKPGFLAMDVVLAGLEEVHVRPFIYKTETIRKVSRLMRCMQFVVADGFSDNALESLKNAGIVVGTPESLFGREVAVALRGLIELLSHAAEQAVDPAKFEKLFKTLSGLPGADGRLRGKLFEFVCAELARNGLHASNVVMGRLVRKDGKDVADIDVRGELGADLFFIEAKGRLPGNVVPDEEVKHWLEVQVPAIEKEHRGMSEFARRKYYFEMWVSGDLSEEGKRMVRERAATVRPTKYTLKVRYIEELVAMARAAGDASTLDVIKSHFRKHPLAEAWSAPAANSIRSASSAPTGPFPSMPGLGGALLSYGSEPSQSNDPPTTSVAGLLPP